MSESKHPIRPISTWPAKPVAVAAVLAIVAVGLLFSRRSLICDQGRKNATAKPAGSNGFTPHSSATDGAPSPDARTMFPGAWLEQILSDLEPFTAQKISRHQLDAACNATSGLVRVLIHANQLYTHASCMPRHSEEREGRPHAVLFMLLRLLCQYELPDMEVVVSYSDHPVVEAGAVPVPPPVFSWCKTAKHLDILMPYWSFVWLPWADSMEDRPLLNDSQWAGKKDLAFWRGSATGGIFTLENWRTQLRAVLVQKCKQRPDLCDAAITNCAQCDAAAKAEMEAALGQHNQTEAETSFLYKYIIMVDGNGSPSSRAKFTLEGDSLILFQETEKFEFFYRSLRPYVHYLPLAHGLEDLYARIEWARSHDDEVKRIVRAAQHFSNTYFTAETVTAYMKVLFQAYAALQAFTPEVSPQYKEGRVWLDMHQNNYFFGYMGEGRCPYWVNTAPSFQ